MRGTKRPPGPDSGELILRYLDGTLPDEQVALLETRLGEDRALRREFAGFLLQHVHLADIAAAERLESAVAASVSESLGERILSGLASGRSLLAGFWLGARWRIWFPVAACLALLVALGLWYGFPTVGEPVLAEIRGDGLSVRRAGETLTVSVGFALQPGDTLVAREEAGAVISFAPEKTRLEIRPGTSMRMIGLSGGKQFGVATGVVEAIVARQRPFRPMVLTTPQAEARVLGTRFTLSVSNNLTRLEVAEGKVRLTRLADRETVKVPAEHCAIAAGQDAMAVLPKTGSVNREWWSNVSWKGPSDALDDPRFPGHPDGRDRMNRFEMEAVTTNRFGLRLRGYVHPPVTGDYEFWLAAQQEAQLFLSPDERASAKMLIATSFSTGAPRDWDADLAARRARGDGSSRWSGAIPLKTGKRYYIEAIVTVPQGEGHLSVAWKRPDAIRELLSGEFLSPAEPSK
jgi:hypothetical protein